MHIKVDEIFKEEIRLCCHFVKNPTVKLKEHKLCSFSLKNT